MVKAYEQFLGCLLFHILFYPSFLLIWCKTNITSRANFVMQLF